MRIESVIVDEGGQVSVFFYYGGVALLSSQSVRNKKPPAMRVREESYTKKSPFRYNEVVQAEYIERKGDFNGQ